MIKNAAAQIIMLGQQQNEIKKLIAKRAKDDAAVQKLTQYKGIGILTAAALEAEIIDIRRFASNDKLASSSGLARREYKSGDNEREGTNHFFNPRLKNAFMTAAMNFVIFNPDSHLTGYYNNLIKRGMKKTDARKRVARALVRVFYKALNSITQSNNLNTRNREEGDMANGSSRSDKDHSNISPLLNIDILHPKPVTLHQPKSSPIEQGCHDRLHWRKGPFSGRWILRISFRDLRTFSPMCHTGKLRPTPNVSTTDVA